jgi:RNA polymerase primary sigma factor
VTDNVAKYKKVAEELYIRTGKRPGPEEVAVEMGVKLEEARKLQEFVEDISPLDNIETTSEDNGRGIPESLQPTKENEAIQQIEMDQQLQELMGQLTGREANIIRYRYGLEDGKAHTLEETGRRFNLTRERIRQIEKDVMKRLRDFVSDHTDDFRP